MERLGLVVPNQQLDILIDDSDVLKVQGEKCSTCPFRPESDFRPQLTRIITNVKATGAIMQCHSTYPSDVTGAMCRGAFDTSLVNLDKFTIEFMPQPISKYLVLPMNGE